MQLKTVTAVAPEPAQKPQQSANAINYNSFLKLLVAQMQNQDPTSPADSAQYLAQLASFSAVEQGVATNSKLDGLMTAVSLSQADALIGHSVTSADGAVTGTIRTIEISDAATIAILEDGRRLALGSGVTIGAR